MYFDGDGQQLGIGKQLWDYGVRVLEGKRTDDQLFCLIYTARTDELGFWSAEADEAGTAGLWKPNCQDFGRIWRSAALGRMTTNG